MSKRKTATIGLIDTRTEAPGILGALIGAYPTMEAAFAANVAFSVSATGTRPHEDRHTEGVSPGWSIG